MLHSFVDSVPWSSSSMLLHNSALNISPSNHFTPFLLLRLCFRGHRYNTQLLQMDPKLHEKGRDASAQGWRRKQNSNILHWYFCFRNLSTPTYLNKLWPWHWKRQISLHSTPHPVFYCSDTEETWSNVQVCVQKNTRHVENSTQPWLVILLKVEVKFVTHNRKLILWL